MVQKEKTKKVEKLGGVINGRYAYFSFENHVKSESDEFVTLSEAVHLENEMSSLGYVVDVAKGRHVVFTFDHY